MSAASGRSPSNGGLGPWEPKQDTGYNAYAKPWVLQRINEKWWGGRQTMQTANYKERRFATEAAAKKAADAANSDGPNDGLSGGEPKAKPSRLNP